MSNSTVKVAIVTRTKDRSLFLCRALQSVAGQTYRDYIHVIVNDGGNQEELEKLLNDLPESQKKKTQVFHRGISSDAPDTIFNESIDRVDSEYFAIHDDDDTWDPEFLQQTVAHLDSRNDIAAVVVRTDKVLEEVSGQTISVKKATQWMPDVHVINLYRQCVDNQFTPIATLFRRSVYEAVGKFDDTLPVVGDWEFGIRLLLKYDADFIDPGYALARYHHRNRTGSSHDAISSHDKHRYYTNRIMNRLLREEIAEGRLGVGYIMSELKYNQGWIASLMKRVLPRFAVSRLKRRVDN